MRWESHTGWGQTHILDVFFHKFYICESQICLLNPRDKYSPNSKTYLNGPGVFALDQLQRKCFVVFFFHFSFFSLIPTFHSPLCTAVHRHTSLFAREWWSPAKQKSGNNRGKKDFPRNRERGSPRESILLPRRLFEITATAHSTIFHLSVKKWWDIQPISFSSLSPSFSSTRHVKSCHLLPIHPCSQSLELRYFLR